MSQKSLPEAVANGAMATSNIGAETTAVRRGRPSNRDRNTEVVAAGESQIADRYEELIDEALQLALGHKPETCPFHHEVLRCPHITMGTRPVQTEDGLHLVDDEEPEQEEFEIPCRHISQQRKGDAAMMRYLIDRVAGRAGLAGEKQVKIEFVRRVAGHVTALFQEINSYTDHDQRAQAFADGMTRMWMVLGDE